jgi:hypothetical protein
MAVLPRASRPTPTPQRRKRRRWYELTVPPTTGTPTVNQSGTIFDSATTVALARQYWIPSTMVSGQGARRPRFSTAGTPYRIDAATNGRLRGDTAGTTGAVALYTASGTAYNPPGDPARRAAGRLLLHVARPKDDMTMWTIQQYCNGRTPTARRSSPARAAAGDADDRRAPERPRRRPLGECRHHRHVRRRLEFYDPGADIPGAEPFNHITATVPGVIVNSVTYDSPTQVTLNISTVGSTPGPKTVTVTNPTARA